MQIKHINLQTDATRSALEREIDQLVAPRELPPVGMIYGLIEDEVTIVDGKVCS